MMSEAAAEANIRFANTDIVPTPDKGADGFVDNEFGKAPAVNVRRTDFDSPEDRPRTTRADPQGHLIDIRRSEEREAERQRERS